MQEQNLMLQQSLMAAGIEIRGLEKQLLGEEQRRQMILQ
jgi:hypothetical protein